MRMYPRRCSSFNRVIARSLTHAVNDYYKQKPKTVNTNIPMTNKPNVENQDLATIIFINILLIIIIAIFIIAV